MSLHKNQLKILQAINDSKVDSDQITIDSNQIAEATGLSINVVRYYIQNLRDEDFISCAEGMDFDGNKKYWCSLNDKGKVALEDLSLLNASKRETSHQTAIHATNIGFIQSGNGTAFNFSQTIGQNLDEISKLIACLRAMAQDFPEVEREAALVHLDDLDEDLSTPQKQTPQRIRTRIAGLLTIAGAIAGVVVGAADFSNNVLELAEKLGISDEFIQSHRIQQPSPSQLNQHVNLASQGIDKAQAEVLRTSLATFADDWNSSEMSIYDNYDAAKAKHEAR